VTAGRRLRIALNDGDYDRRVTAADILNNENASAGIGRFGSAGDIVDLIPRPEATIPGWVEITRPNHVSNAVVPVTVSVDLGTRCAVAVIAETGRVTDQPRADSWLGSEGLRVTSW